MSVFPFQITRLSLVHQAQILTSLAGLTTTSFVWAWDSTGPNCCHLPLVAMVEAISYSKWKGTWFIPQPPEFAGCAVKGSRRICSVAEGFGTGCSTAVNSG